jgi:poly-beta-1,6-N-acetyl-D-glucosamine N-deacetylase
VKTIVKKFLSLFFFIFRFYYRNRIVVLAYHDISNESLFEGQLKLIRKYYRPITIEMLENFLKHNTVLPQYSVLITLDDGDPSLRDKGLTIFKTHEIPATAFIISENVRNQQKFWWRTLEDYYSKLGKRRPEARKEIGRLKKIPNEARLKALQAIERQDPLLMKDPSALTITDLQAMEQAGVTIGSHTATHPILNQCTDQELESEFSISKLFFDSSGIRSFKYFAYPNGDYSDEVLPILKKYGIVLAFAFDHRINKKNIEPYAISRIRVNSTDSLSEFKIRITGISTLFNFN